MVVFDLVYQRKNTKTCCVFHFFIDRPMRGLNTMLLFIFCFKGLEFKECSKNKKMMKKKKKNFGFGS